MWFLVFLVVLVAYHVIGSGLAAKRAGERLERKIEAAKVAVRQRALRGEPEPEAGGFALWAMAPDERRAYLERHDDEHWAKVEAEKRRRDYESQFVRNSERN